MIISTAPAYSLRWFSSHSTLSASRWLVGSSSSRIDGFWISSRVSATRRFSPPDRLVDRRSRRAGSATPPSPVRAGCRALQPSTASILAWRSPISSISASKSVSSLGSPISAEIALKRSTMSAISRAPSLTFSSTVLVGSSSRLLRQIADGDVLARPRLAGEIRVDAGHDLHQRRLAGAVGADDADLGALIELQVDVAEHRLGRAGEGLGHVLHDISVLGGHGGTLLRGFEIGGKFERADSDWAARLARRAQPKGKRAFTAPRAVLSHRDQSPGRTICGSPPLAACRFAALAVPAIAQRALPTAPVKVDPTVAKPRDAALKDDVAYDIVEGLTTEVGPRLAGDRSGGARARLGGGQAQGARVQERPCRNLSRCRSGCAARRRPRSSGPIRRSCCSPRSADSGATPPEGITAPVVYFPTLQRPARRARRQPDGQDRVRVEPDEGDAGRQRLRRLRRGALHRPEHRREEGRGGDRHPLDRHRSRAAGRMPASPTSRPA